MITQEKLQIYEYFSGDIDLWARTSTKEQKAMIDDNDWFLIDEFLQDILLLKKGLASEVYSKNVEKKIKEKCDNNETVIKLMKMA